MKISAVFVHVFPMLPAPLLFISLGAVLVASRLLPRVLGYLALAQGLAFAIVGLAGLFNTTALGATTVLLVGQELWILAAAITLTLQAVTRPTLHGRVERPILNTDAH